MSPTDMTIVAALTHVVAFARAEIRTDPDHAGFPNHRADERVRDLLEQVIYDS